MIKLYLEKNIVNLNLNFDFKWKDKLMFFYSNINDKRNILKEFVICDFKQSKLICYNSFSKKNLDILEKNDIVLEQLLFLNPHSIISFWERYLYIFVEWHSENFPFFYLLDTFDEILTIYTLSDLNVKGYNFNKGFFSPTNFLAKDNNIYFSFYSIEDEFSYYLKTNLGFSSTEVIYKEHCKKGIIDHTVFNSWDLLISSEFLNNKLFLPIKNLTLTPKQFYRSFKPYYLKYLRLRQKLSLGEFLKIFTTVFRELFIKTSVSEPSIQYLYNNKLDIKSFSDYTDYKVEFQRWEIKTYNLKTKEIRKYLTWTWAPAHIELDQNNNIYTSSHNFMSGKKFDKENNKWLRQVCFLWPAYIDKFSFSDWELKHKWSFFHKEWFRYTSHKVLNYNWRSIICTIWHPNRLYFIYGDTMELCYYEDLWTNEINSYSENIIAYMNNINLGFIIALEVFLDRYILITWDNKLIVYDFENKEIIDNIKLIERKDSYMSMTHLQKFI